MHDIEQSTLDAAAGRLAAEHPGGEVHRAGRPFVVVERAADARLLGLAHRRDAVVREHGGHLPAGAFLECFEVDLAIVCHMRKSLVSTSQGSVRFNCKASNRCSEVMDYIY